MSSNGQLDFFSSNKEIKSNKQIQLDKQDMDWTKLAFLVVDTETSGLEPDSDKIIEIAWTLYKDGKILEEESYLCKIDRLLPAVITKITGITDEMLEGQHEFKQRGKQLLEAIKKADFLVAYNAKFDKSFIESELSRVNLSLPNIDWVDPYIFIKQIDKYKKGKKLSDAAKRWGIVLDNAHRALADVHATGELLYKLASHLKIDTLKELVSSQKVWQKKQHDSYQEYLKNKKTPKTNGPKTNF